MDSSIAHNGTNWFPIPFSEQCGYDAAGLRDYQSVTLGTGGAYGSYDEGYLYDGSDLIFRWSGFPNGVATTDLGTDHSAFYIWGPTGPVMEFDLSGDSKAFNFDPQGSYVNTTNTTVMLYGVSYTQPLFYDGYGLPLNGYTGDQRVLQQPFQYKGQFGYYSDVHTGLCYCQQRYFDPRSGRWISRDPAGLEGGVNVYQYSSGNPLMVADPSGLQGIPPDPFRVANEYWGPVTPATVWHSMKTYVRKTDKIWRDDMSRAEAECEFDDLMRRLPALIAYFRSTLRQEDVDLSGGSQRMLTCAGNWVAARGILVTSKTVVDPRFRSADPGNYLSLETLSACCYLGYLFGERILEGVTGVRWELATDDKHDVDYHRAVIRSPSGKEQLEPVTIAVNFVLGRLRQTHGNRTLGDLYMYWQEALSEGFSSSPAVGTS